MFASILRIYRNLTIFQQAHYKLRPYLCYELRMSLELVVPYTLSQVFWFTDDSLLLIVFMLNLFFYELSLVRRYKLPFNLTRRALWCMAFTYLFSAILFYLPYSYAILSFMLMIPFFISNCLSNLKNRYYLHKAINKRLSFNGDVIAITGSFGKTTTKLFCSTILDSLKPLYTKKSYNTPMGISMVLNEERLSLYNLLILEFGATKKGDISHLAKSFRPNIGVVIEVGPMHLDSFKSIDGILEEKMQLIECLPKNGLAILNYDNKYIRNYHIHNDVRKISFGYNYGDIRIKRFDDCVFLEYLGIDIFSFNTKSLSSIELLDLIPGIILGLYYNLDKELIIAGISNLHKPHARLEVKRIRKNIIIDDSFNANLTGALAAIDRLSLAGGQMVCITPGFVEMKKVSREQNRRLAEALRGKGIKIYIIHSQSGDELYYSYLSNEAYLIDSYEKAFKLFMLIEEPKALLIENDLPDIYQDMVF